MNHTDAEWLLRIVTNRTARASDHWYSAFCPICGYCETATIADSEVLALAEARGKALIHMHRKHPQAVTPVEHTAPGFHSE
jgi:hypothetical protein